jgi:hypothetical protein
MITEDQLSQLVLGVESNYQFNFLIFSRLKYSSRSSYNPNTNPQHLLLQANPIACESGKRTEEQDSLPADQVLQGNMVTVNLIER